MRPPRLLTWAVRAAGIMHPFPSCIDAAVVTREVDRQTDNHVLRILRCDKVELLLAQRTTASYPRVERHTQFLGCLGKVAGAAMLIPGTLRLLGDGMESGLYRASTAWMRPLLCASTSSP
jgi:hypothetical protein